MEVLVSLLGHAATTLSCGGAGPPALYGNLIIRYSCSLLHYVAAHHETAVIGPLVGGGESSAGRHHHHTPLIIINLS